jgi:DNA-binding CsgD family transcriptional regulator
MTRHSAELSGKILKMLNSGKSQGETSRELNISLGTVGYL